MKLVRQSFVLLLVMLTFAFLSGCKKAKSSDAGKPSITGPIADNPVFNVGHYLLKDLGYQKQEYFFSGTATSYKAAGTLGEDGKWAVQPAGKAPFTSRFVVIRPRDPSHFNGTVVVEWLNVTSGADQAAEWAYTHRELLREGFAYVAVSVQRVGIEGGESYFQGGGQSLKEIDSSRYHELNHPGDAYSYDIFTQAAGYLRGNTPSVLGPLKPQWLIAAGESQSAFFLTTYANAIDPIAKAFDGFLIHSRSGYASGLGGARDGSAERGQPENSPVLIRADVRVPVLMTITETDVLAPISMYLRARQPDSDHIRTWEIAGAAHADNYVFGFSGSDSGSLPSAKLAAGFAPMDVAAGENLEVPINNAPQHHYVEEAAIHSLNRWLTSGVAPPSAPVLEVKDQKFVLDSNGNVRGGIRTPWVDVPTATLSGLGRGNEGILSLVGTTKPFTAAQLHTLYPQGKAEYLAHFQTALQSAVNAGFILAADQEEIKGLAAESWPADAK